MPQPGPATFPGPATYPGAVIAVPAFTTLVPTLAQLNALSVAVSFLVDCDVRPQFTAFMSTAVQTTTAGAWKQVAFDHVAFDPTGMFGVGGAGLPIVTIVTQGLYSFEACVPIEANTNDDVYTGRFLITGGTHNPHLASGSTQGFGYRGGKLSLSSSAAADNATCLSDWAPFCLYPGDTVKVQVYTAVNSHTIDKNQNTSYIQGRFVPKFSGALVALGS